MMTCKYLFTLIIITCSITGQSLSITYKIDETIKFSRNGFNITNPFSGGYQSLYVQALNFNSNNLVDLILLNNGFRKPVIFEQTETYSSNFKKLEIQFEGIKLDRWFQFIDYDFDGDFDVLTLDNFDVLGVQLNNQSNISPNFGDFQRLSDENGNLIITEFGNYPVIYDYNQDGKFDLFLSTQTDGRIIYFENSGTLISKFILENSNFGNVSVVASAKDQRHGKSSFAFTHFSDLNSLDILWGDQFQQYFYYLTNIGTRLLPDYKISDSLFSANNVIQSSATYNVPIPVHITNDEFEDLIVLPQFSNTDNLQFYTSNNLSELELDNLELISTIDEGLLSFIDVYDIDADGLDDLVISTFRNSDNFYHLSFYRNIASSEFPQFSEFDFSTNLTFPWQSILTNAYDFQIIDMNNDQVWDIVYVDDSGKLNYSINSGTPTSPIFLFTSEVRSGLGNFASFKITDLNSDNQLELISSSQSGRVQLFTSNSTFFDTQISSDLLNFQYDGWINFDLYDKNRVLLYHQKESSFYSFKINTNFTADSLVQVQLNLPEIGQSATITLLDLDKNNQFELAFGNQNGGIMLFTPENEVLPVPSSNYPVYPNPSRQNQQILLQNEPEQIRFYNLLGQQIKITYTINSNLLKWTFPNHLANGIYFISIDKTVYKLIKFN